MKQVPEGADNVYSIWGTCQFGSLAIVESNNRDDRRVYELMYRDKSEDESRFMLEPRYQSW